MMAYHEFVVPTGEEILDALGVEPEESVEDPMVRIIPVLSSTGDTLVISFDVAGRSVRCQWLRGSVLILDLFREAATRLTVDSGNGNAWIRVCFETDSLAGELEVQVHPEIRVNDRLVFR
jgi:hypothetical protein